MTLPEHLQALIKADYPRFSDPEMSRRRKASATLLREAGCTHLLFCGANRFGSVVPWLTGWPVTTEAVGVLTPGEADTLFVQYHNHVPLARRIARDARVEWGEQSATAAAIAELKKRGAQSGKVATIGPLGAEQHAALTAAFGKVVTLNKAYVALRQVKSAEELDWLRIGAHFSDLGMMALRDHL